MLAENLELIEKKNIFIMQPIKNNLINQGLFHKLLYSNNIFTSNGIYIKLNLLNTKYLDGKLIYDIYKNINILNKIYEIEKYILQNIKNNKKQHFKIYDQFKYGFIKTNNTINSINSIILKLSGIWENDNAIGISYKIININHCIDLSNN